jgi:alpha-tubulin suppressor-like RCC1 family protein
MLGAGAEADDAAHPIPQQVANLSSVQELSVGARFVLARTNDGAVYGWGDGIDGELANDSVLNWYLPAPTLISGLTGTTAISAGEKTACAIVAAGQAQCWGRTGDPITATGEPGTALMSADGVVRVVPTNVPGVAGVARIAAGVRAGVAVADDGTVYGWGDSRWGLLAFPQGNPGSWFSAKPIGASPYGFSGKVEALTLGDNHGCALIDNGHIQCWGDNESGQLGLGYATPTWAQAIQDVPALVDVVQIDAGGDATCALMRTGEIYCWGANTYGQAGHPSDGGVDSVRAVPSLVKW